MQVKRGFIPVANSSKDPKVADSCIKVFFLCHGETYK